MAKKGNLSMGSFRKTLTGWGLYPRASCLVKRPERYHQLEIPEEGALGRGFGRSYGDAALNTNHPLILMERLDRFLAFDEETGLLQAEAGTSLAEILKVFVPKGWFLPVTPGTKFVTLGGCIACDIHGKNHHVDGTFGKYIKELELLLPDGTKKRCSPTKNREFFWATIGGLGLTGIITEATLQLIPISTSFIRVRNYSAPDLEGVMHILEDPSRDDKYTVAWIDCLAKGKALGRGIVMNGHHAKENEIPSNTVDPLVPHNDLKISLPLPSWSLNPYSMQLFNSFFYSWNKRKKSPLTMHYDPYFYPLDKVKNWNQLYGKKGFLQYQFAIPYKNAFNTMRVFLERLSSSPYHSYLAVLKRFGEEGQGLLSFPFEGYTLAMDLPITDVNIFPFLDGLDDLVLSEGGRLYLAKDARLKGEKLSSMYPRLDEWLEIKKNIDPTWKVNSDLARRLRLEER